MTRPRVVLAFLLVACQGAASVRKQADVGPVAFFRDTTLIAVSAAEARTFTLKTESARDSLRAVLHRERELWRAGAPPDYRFLLRVGCFCPGPRGWLLMEVRSGQPLRAWDPAGHAASLADWNTFSIEGLFDNLERSVDRDGVVQIAFDPRWHFPAYVHTAALPGPDMWGIFEARALRPTVSSTLDLAGPDEPGTPLTVSAVVRDSRGRPIAGVVVHVYQTDVTGRYTAAQPMDEPHARLNGRVTADAAGRFEIRTIRPGGYPRTVRAGGRDRRIPAHIHLDVRAPGRSERRFQLVFADDSLLSDPYWADWVRRLRQPVLTVRPADRGVAGTLILTLD